MSDATSVLAVIGLDGRGNADYLYDRGKSRGLPSAYADDIDYTRRPVEPRPEANDCTVTTPTASYTFEQTNADRARVADLISEELGLHRNDVLEALSKCEPAGEVRFEFE